MSQSIPVAEPDLTGNELAYVADAIRSNWISSSGAYVERFEREFARICEAGAAVGVSNGTVALHLALLALGVRPGDEVLVPSLTYVATANAVRYVGAEPIFVDVDPNTWCINPDAVEDSITLRTKGMIPVHLYGHPADMDRINHLAAVHGLWVVEDAAEAHCAEYKGRPTGSLARIGTFSFYGNKIFTSGEGGAVTVQDPELELRIRTLRGQGMDPRRRYYFPVTGYNFRLTNIACAILCAQLERAEALLSRRREIFEQYRDALSGIPGIGFQKTDIDVTLAPWLFCITIDPIEFGHSRDGLMAILSEEGIDTRPFFTPLHQLPPFREMSRARGEILPTSERLGQTGMNLPTYTGMTEDTIMRVATVIRHAHR